MKCVSIHHEEAEEWPDATVFGRYINGEWTAFCDRCAKTGMLLRIFTPEKDADA